MQLTGHEFTRASAAVGNDLRTFPDYPAEIRAPAGTLAGVSSFQIQFSSGHVFTPGDRPDVLVAMNPAALRANLGDLGVGGQVIVNSGAFTANNLEKAGYASDPLLDGTLDRFRTFPIDIQKLTELALADTALSAREISRARNMFALGVVLWLYNRPTEPTLRYLAEKFAGEPALLEGNQKALAAGSAFAESTEMFGRTYVVKKADIVPGRYRNVSGNEATALGLLTACRLAGLRGFLGSYPITPASDILHALARCANHDFVTFQAEDEIAAVGAAIGASYGGSIGITTTSGPGVALKQEAISLAVMAELPLVIVNVQRGGPSTGLPTKTEQADLLQAVSGRHGEAPVPVLAASSPADCFDAAIEAVRIAIRHMTPVFLLTDGYLANGQEPWRIPDAHALAPIDVRFRTDPEGFHPYQRDDATLARAWVRPGTPDLEHRIGGLEKDASSGEVSYDGANHEQMVRLRAQKVQRVADGYPPLEVLGPRSGDLLLVGWGSTRGAITAAVDRLREAGRDVSQVHLRHLAPLHHELGELLRGFRHVLVPELNLGQLTQILRATYLVDARVISKVQGQPFGVGELVDRIEEALR